MEIKINYLTADQHFNDSRFPIMCRPFNRVGDMNAKIIREHNKIITEHDQVVFNGDVSIDKDGWKNVKKLKGKKILIRGNHERQFSDEFLKGFVDKIIDEGDGLLLKTNDLPVWITHYPSQSKKEYFNCVGHIHSSWKVQLNMLNVGVDVHHFRPVALKDVRFYYKAICEFYDEDVWVGDHSANVDFKGVRGKIGPYFTQK